MGKGAGEQWGQQSDNEDEEPRLLLAKITWCILELLLLYKQKLGIKFIFHSSCRKAPFTIPESVYETFNNVL